MIVERNADQSRSRRNSFVVVVGSSSGVVLPVGRFHLDGLKERREILQMLFFDKLGSAQEDRLTERFSLGVYGTNSVDRDLGLRVCMRIETWMSVSFCQPYSP